MHTLGRFSAASFWNRWFDLTSVCKVWTFLQEKEKKAKTLAWFEESKQFRMSSFRTVCASVLGPKRWSIQPQSLRSKLSGLSSVCGNIRWKRWVKFETSSRFWPLCSNRLSGLGLLQTAGAFRHRWLKNTRLWRGSAVSGPTFAFYNSSVCVPLTMSQMQQVRTFFI